ncbi:hypothetical protein [Pedobacter sp. BMA]|uniref:hypothetical protein n=1 Tax=Pedobacter sp. BMA TaxID=1663685 RepID=UPI000B19EFDE|nr:hypothetical protein [Pedobacter sp. BMA]
MKNHEILNVSPAHQQLNDKFNEQVIESYWSENGELIYILKDEANLEQYAGIAKKLLTASPELDQNFTGKVAHTNQDIWVRFEL